MGQKDMQLGLLETETISVAPFRKGLLKWVGNKQKFAHEIASYLPSRYGTYYEPFLGSGAVLGTLAPNRAVGSDCFAPLIEIWQTLALEPELLKLWYAERWTRMKHGHKVDEYERIKAAYNIRPNAADLLFLCRSCYGGVVRFRQADGFMSTPCGIHNPMPPRSFSSRVDVWHSRVKGAVFLRLDYQEVLEMAKPGDIVYCDPPYKASQGILYGAQSFDLSILLRSIEKCKERGVFVALSIDGTKKSGSMVVDLPIPKGLFEREVSIHCGRSMLKRFQMDGQSLEDEVVTDRLLLTK